MMHNPILAASQIAGPSTCARWKKGVQTLIGLLCLAQAAPCFAYSAGGSDFGWYKVDHCDGSHGYIFNQVGEHADEIEAVLRIMYGNGQRRLRLPVFFSQHPPNSGVLQTTSTGLSETDLDHISSILAMIRRLGFVQVIVTLLPVGESVPSADPTLWHEDSYRFYLKIVTQVRSRLVASHEPYLLDLFNEGLPFPFQKGWIAFDKRLWSDYTRLYGSKDSLGFSATEDAGRLTTIGWIYGKILPPFLDIHIYRPDTISSLARELRVLSLSRWPWIIGETVYDDEKQIIELRDDTKRAGINLLYILQWPGHRNSGCPAISTVPLSAPASLVHP